MGQDKLPELSARKPASSGMGFGTYILAAAVLAAAFAGLQRLSKDKPVVEEPSSPGAPVQRGGAPLSMPGTPGGRSAGKTVPDQGQGGPEYVSLASDMKGAVLAPGISGRQMDAAVFFTGEGGPSSFEGRVARDGQQWAALWRSVGGRDAPPALDPKREMAVAVFGGIRPAGSTVKIHSAEAEGGKLVVVYSVEKPSEPLGGTCRPYKVVFIQASSLPVVFRDAKAPASK